MKDLITTEDLAQCLSSAARLLSAQAEHSVEVFAPKPQDIHTIHGILPEHAARIEEELRLLSSSFFTRDRAGTVRSIHNLYHAQLSGMTQFCFLQKINSVLISWIINECVRHGISAATVFAGTGSPLSILESAPDPTTACSLLCQWVENLMDSTEQESKESERIRKVIAYLNENYHQDLSLQSIADHFHIHKVYLSRSFKEETGITLNSYLNYLRIEKAKLLLCMKTYRTTEIAYMVGFNNTQNFYSVFRKLVGCSPSDYMEETHADSTNDRPEEPPCRNS